jgi:hypothetical protein
MKKILTIIILFSKILGANSSLDVLKNNVSAKNIAMSGANSTTETNIFSGFTNPAALSKLSNYEIGLNYSNGFEDSKYSYISFGFPIKEKIFSDISNPYIGFSFYMTDLGDMIERSIINGNIVEKSISTEKNKILIFSYSEKIGKQTTYITPTLKSNFESSIGFNIKLINSKLLEYSANTYALDVGYLGSLSDIGLDFGFSLLNTLGKIKYIEEKNNLPTTFKAGLSYTKPTIMENKTKFALEYDNYIVDKKNSLSIGIEYTIENIFSAQAGYKFMDDNKGPSVGVTLYGSGFEASISTVFYDIYKYTSISIKYSFGKKEEKQEKEKYSKPLKKVIEEDKKAIQKSKPSKEIKDSDKKEKKDVIIIF